MNIAAWKSPLFAACLVSLALLKPTAAAEVPFKKYDVVIAGGSTAALAAAFTAADEGARVALLEPTDWIGGQLTASGVPAVDEAWHRITDRESGEVLLDVSAIARDPRNMTPFFRDALLAIGNPGRGWVSRYCFEPRRILEDALQPRAEQLADRLTIFRNTVVKRASLDRDGRLVLSVTAIQRTPKPGVAHKGYDRLPSADLADWYSPAPSERFDKRVLQFTGRDGQAPVFIDATEWGELLVLARAPYLQGVEASEQSTESNDRCGQATTFGFVQRYHAEPVSERERYPLVPGLGFGSYREKPNAWERVWTYRRLRAASEEPSPGDLSLQNWGYDSRTNESGNDYPYGYLFLSKEYTAEQRDDWRGGVDLEVMAAAERQAFGWHEWFRRAAPEEIDPDCFTLEGEVLGTGHGLSKLPYIRDTRRAIGLDGFRVTLANLSWRRSNSPPPSTGTVFPDRVALGAYAADIHPLAGCEYPEKEFAETSTLPFYLPYRALTVDGKDNLLVAGKTMAQTFLANSATRLHPIEWSTGCAAGAAAAHLAATGGSTRDGLAEIDKIQAIVKKHTPIDWILSKETP